MTHVEVAEKIKNALEALRSSKPKDRSEVDRVYGVCITEMEKVLGYFEHSTPKDPCGVECSAGDRYL